MSTQGDKSPLRTGTAPVHQTAPDAEASPGQPVEPAEQPTDTPEQPPEAQDRPTGTEDPGRPAPPPATAPLATEAQATVAPNVPSDPSVAVPPATVPNDPSATVPPATVPEERADAEAEPAEEPVAVPGQRAAAEDHAPQPEDQPAHPAEERREPPTAAMEQPAAVPERSTGVPEGRRAAEESAAEPVAVPEQRAAAEEPTTAAPRTAHEGAEAGEQQTEARHHGAERPEEAPALPEQPSATRAGRAEPADRPEPEAKRPAEGWEKSAARDGRPLWAPRRPPDPPPVDEQRPSFPEAAQHRRRLVRVFRLPTPADPSPASGRLLVMCAWATALGVLGLAVALRGLVGILAKAVPTWYEPALIVAGLAGILLTVGGFTSVQRRNLPWIMLSLATVPLLAALGVTVGTL